MDDSTILSRHIMPYEDECFRRMLETRSKRASTKGITKLRCAIYARKSQEDTKDTSLSAQITYCTDLIRRLRPAPNDGDIPRGRQKRHGIHEAHRVP